MGIKRFNYYITQNHPKCLKNIKHDEVIENDIDFLLLDLNGNIHTCAQKVFEYGNYKPVKNLLKPQTSKKEQKSYDERISILYNEVWRDILHIIKITKPKKGILIAIDGVCPLAKQNQQRQRRFKSSSESKESSNDFNPTVISVGTTFMINISKFLHKKIKEYSIQNKINIFFSDVTCIGEGEHKLISYVKKYLKKKDTFLLYGNDADYYMLSLSTHHPICYILRDDIFNSIEDYILISIQEFRKVIFNLMKWSNDLSIECILNDFIFLMFFTGNDFLPNIPSIDILNNSIENILEIYKVSCLKNNSYLVGKKRVKFCFNKPVLKQIFLLISQTEQKSFNIKVKKGRYFPDSILNSSKNHDNTIDIEKYRIEYSKKLNDSIENTCLMYLEGLDWILEYYTSGTKNWNYLYTDIHAPFSYHLVQYIDKYKYSNFKGEFKYNDPYLQLLCILPPRSFNLLPSPLNELYFHPKLFQFYPEKFEIQLAGKRKEWEGVPLIPFLDMKLIKKIYNDLRYFIQVKDFKRNKISEPVIYKKTGQSFYIKI